MYRHCVQPSVPACLPAGLPAYRPACLHAGLLLLFLFLLPPPRPLLLPACLHACMHACMARERAPVGRPGPFPVAGRHSQSPPSGPQTALATEDAPRAQDGRDGQPADTGGTGRRRRPAGAPPRATTARTDSHGAAAQARAGSGAGVPTGPACQDSSVAAGGERAGACAAPPPAGSRRPGAAGRARRRAGRGRRGGGAAGDRQHGAEPPAAARRPPRGGGGQPVVPPPARAAGAAAHAQDLAQGVQQPAVARAVVSSQGRPLRAARPARGRCRCSRAATASGSRAASRVCTPAQLGGRAAGRRSDLARRPAPERPGRFGASTARAAARGRVRMR